MDGSRNEGNDAGSRRTKGDRMRFFRRKATTEDEAERCPQFSERVPEGADHCFMCGADLRTLSPRSPERPVNTPVDRTMRL